MSRSKSAKFTFPSEGNQVFYEQDTLAVSYDSEYANASLWTFCYQDSKLVTKNIIRQAASFNGTQLVLIGFHTSSDKCWFNLRNSSDSNDKGFNSVHFALSENQRSQTTLGLPSSLTTPTATSSSIPTHPSTSHEHSGLSNGAKVGVGIVVAFSILALAGFAGAYFMQRRKRKTSPVPLMTWSSEKAPSLHELASSNVYHKQLPDHHKQLPELPG